MGSTKIGTTDSSSKQSSSTQYTPTPEQTELDKLQLEQARASQAGQIDIQKQGLFLGSQLLQGKDLPGYLQGLPGGIDEDTVNSIAQSAMRDIQPGMQKAGLLDSGINASISARTSADIRTQAKQFNIQNLMQLLNQGLGGQAQVQAPIQTGAASLGGRLGALAGTSSTGQTDSNSHRFGSLASWIYK